MPLTKNIAPFFKTSLDRKVKDVNIEEISNHKINDAKGFRSLLIYSSYKELIKLINEMKHQDFLLLKKYNIWSLLHLTLDELYELILNIDKNFNVFQYDRLCRKFLYLKGICSLKIGCWIQ